MTFVQKRDAALAVLTQAGIGRSNYAPPLLRLLWWLGIQAPPPHFNGFVSNALMMGTYFAAAFGSVMTLSAIFLMHQVAPGWLPAALYFATVALVTGPMFGLFMASYYAYGARRHNLPKWRDFQPAGAVE